MFLSGNIQAQISLEDIPTEDPEAKKKEIAKKLKVELKRLQEVEEVVPTDERVFETLGSSGGGPSLFYDARVVGLDSRNDRTMFEGDVVVIGSGVYIAADEVIVDNKNSVLDAQGRVVVLSNREVFTGDNLKYFLLTGDLKIKNAVLVVNSKEEIEKMTSEVLGFSKEEVFYETQRGQRIDYLREKKLGIRDTYLEESSFGEKPRKELVDQYALSLEQEELVRSLPNPAFSKLTETRRKAYAKRRGFWAQARAKTRRPLAAEAYFRIDGDTLERTNGNDYRAQNADWTPCQCDEDETPAWGFHSENILAQREGYVEFEDAVLEIKGIPVLFFPRLKLPLKSRRQSGFLIPTLRTGDSNIGTVYTQPVYFAFDRDFDTTLTSDFFQERGTRIRAETRYEHRKHSGLVAKFETIRDRVWLDDRSTRESLTEYHRGRIFGDGDRDQEIEEAERNIDQGYTLCQQQRINENEPGDTEDHVANCFRDNVEKPLIIPGNTWRSSEEWEGRIFLTPRISFVSKGEIRSDHRYVEDLLLTDNFAAAFTPARFANSFNIARGKLDYTGSDFYAGLTSSFGDNVLVPDDRFTGLQSPGRVDIQSRTYNLDYGNMLNTPIYASMEAAVIPIQEKEGTRQIKSSTYQQLGSGRWENMKLNFVSPLKMEGVYTIDLQADTDIRRVKHSGTYPGISRLHSWQTGLNFRLPMDGMWKYSETSESDAVGSGQRYFHHLMDFVLSFATRPNVTLRGNYWNNEGGNPMKYLGADRLGVNDGSILPEDIMARHRTVAFSTSHRWKTFKKTWKLINKKQKPGVKKEEEKLSFRQKAIQELMYSQDQLIDNPDSMYNVRSGIIPAPEKKIDWFINRYRLIDEDEIEPVSFYFTVAYDFLAVQVREDQLARNQRIEEQIANGEEPEGRPTPEHELAKPLSPPVVGLGLNWEGYSLNTMVKYNTYNKNSEEVEFRLGLPQFYDTNLKLEYLLRNNPVPLQESLVLKKEANAKAILTSTVIPNIELNLHFLRKSVEDQPKDQYESILGVTYLDPSGCWGLRAMRQKLLDREEQDARYILELIVLFMGARQTQDVSAGLVREFRGDRS